MLSNSVRGERDDVDIIMTNVSNMECIQDCQAKCQRINAVSSSDRALEPGKKYQEQTKRKWNMIGGSQSLVRTLVYQQSRKQRTISKQMGQKRGSPACLMKTLKPMKRRKSPFLRRLIPLFHTGHGSPKSPRIDFFKFFGRIREVSLKKILQS